ncbi:unnamed protein product [Prunus armeniaca]|uniref:Uncharacterized protein n=1 Tax=Prunus armeniaca TaxID=36596 RepID=A0A6J5WWL5_PRUAR|nr:unnamed protein product [Prunus armeniaca]
MRRGSPGGARRLTYGWSSCLLVWSIKSRLRGRTYVIPLTGSEVSRGHHSSRLSESRLSSVFTPLVTEYRTKEEVDGQMWR